MTLRYEEPIRTFRFLLSDGRVIDVEAAHDGPRLRDWVLKQAGWKKTSELRIVGATAVDAQEPML